MFNNKLYNKYYPIQNEIDKMKFLDTNWLSLYKEIVEINKLCKSDIYVRKNDYISKIRKPITVFGDVNYKNIQHNEHIKRKMEEDENIQNLEKRSYKLEEIANKLMMNEPDKISADDINYILLFLNKEHHKNLLMFLSLSIFIVVVFFVL
jgi:hypothetical protein